MDDEKLAMQRRIDTLDQHAIRLHAALTEYERENARLKAELETVKRERDAAVKDLEASKSCGSCIHFEEKSFLSQDADLPSQCVNCILDRSQYVWRGVQENGGAEMESDLKPCPFCGGEAMLCSTTSFNGAIAYFVICNSEDCLMRGGAKFLTTVSEAREAWNRRAGDGK